MRQHIFKFCFNFTTIDKYVSGHSQSPIFLLVMKERSPFELKFVLTHQFPFHSSLHTHAPNIKNKATFEYEKNHLSLIKYAARDIPSHQYNYMSLQHTYFRAEMVHVLC
jgi:hypothetical protein